MKYLVDTSVWSMAFRRSGFENESSKLLTKLIQNNRAVMCGPVRQEILSGIKSPEQYQLLRDRLRAFRDIRISLAHYESAAELSNICRAQGIQGSHTDFLLCALSIAYNLTLLTLDKDFSNFGKYIPLKLLQLSNEDQPNR